MLYGRDPPTLLRGENLPLAMKEVNQMLQDKDVILNELMDQPAKAQNRMKTQALKDQAYKPAKRLNQKLSPR